MCQIESGLIKRRQAHKPAASQRRSEDAGAILTRYCKLTHVMNISISLPDGNAAIWIEIWMSTRADTKLEEARLGL